MKDLIHIIDILPDSIKSHLKSALRSSSKSVKSQSKYYQLFDLLCRYKNNKEEFYQKRLYGSNISSEYRVLKHRLKHKIIHLLLNEEILNRSSTFENLDLEMLECLRQLYAVRIILRLKGNSHVALNILNDIITKAKKNEHYLLIIEYLSLKKYNSAFLRKNDDFKKTNAELEKYHSIYKLVNKANDYYYQLILLNQTSNSSLAKNERIKNLRIAIHELRTDYEYTKSPLALYFVLLLELEYFELNGDYEAGKEACEQLCKHVLDSPSVRKEQRIGSAYINAAFFNAKLRNYEEALKGSDIAIKHIPNHSINHLIYSTIKLKLLIYLSHFKEAKSLYDKLSRLAEATKAESIITQLNMIEAIIYYKQNNFQKALKILATNTKIDQDKHGYGVYQLILQVICLIKLNKVEEADNVLSSIVRKRTAFITKNENKRIDLLIQFLSLWSKSSYCKINKTNYRINEVLSALQNQNSSLAWTPLDFEIISYSEELCQIALPNKKKSLSSPI